MPLSELAVSSILSSIENHHLAFIAEVLGLDMLSLKEQQQLSKAGMLPMGTADLIKSAYQFGVLSGEITPGQEENIGAKQFLQMVGVRGGLSAEEEGAVDYARKSAAIHIRGLGTDFAKKAGAIIHEGNKSLHRGRMLTARNIVSEGVSKSHTVKTIARRLKKAFGQQHRDWMRVAATEVNNALQEGRLQAIMKSATPGEEPLVYKRPRPDACPYCKVLYLNKGIPKIFKLGEVVGNGSNFGRKANRPLLKSTEWKPIIGSTHPWCRCVLHRLPPGFGFDASGTMEYRGKSYVHKGSR